MKRGREPLRDTIARSLEQQRRMIEEARKAQGVKPMGPLPRPVVTSHINPLKDKKK